MELESINQSDPTDVTWHLQQGICKAIGTLPAVQSCSVKAWDSNPVFMRHGVQLLALMTTGCLSCKSLQIMCRFASKAFNKSTHGRPATVRAEGARTGVHKETLGEDSVV
eukprot:scaffold368204_cov44-Prasinocladus_malaysianus.AAC.1